MAKVSEKLDVIESRIMEGLKDFQRATVERIDTLYRSGQQRILVSDEVGLGKTLIARGTVAKFAIMRKEQGDDLVKVVYICSNAAIAEQNLNKLRISKELRTDSSSTSRLSMQHLNIFEQENDPDVKNRYIQLIPLTPDTSFRMSSGAGTADERALMYAILRRVPVLAPYDKQLEALMKKNAEGRWNNWSKAEYERQVKECEKHSNGTYFSYMIDAVERGLTEKTDDGRTLLNVLTEICEGIISRRRDNSAENRVVSSLRSMFAQISIDKLEPDIIIMDEFQRFKYLLDADPQSDIGKLTSSFFDTKTVRMLLLSATPYKMYSTMEEIEETQQDEHYEEFLNVMQFLNDSTEQYGSFKTVWDDYAVKLKELTRGETTIIQAQKAASAAEDAMYRAVCRTERISAKEGADMIDDHEVKEPIKVLEQDVKSYLQMERLLHDIGASYHVPVDYVKSCPYLMSFMRDYQLKKKIEKYFTKHTDETHKANKDALWLKWKSINRYDKISLNNARLENVMETVLRRGDERLLWIPPSKPYYESQGIFKDMEGFTKTLIFSSWEMVPRMLACMISYEAERRTVGSLVRAKKGKKAHYFRNNDDKEEKRYPPPRLNFSLKDGRANAMALFCLLYPSQFLVECYEPIISLNRKARLSDIEKDIRCKIEAKLHAFPDPQEGRPDARWYYLMPIYLDDDKDVDEWFSDRDRLINEEEEGRAARRNRKGLEVHFDRLLDEYNEAVESDLLSLGKRPADLIDVLTDMAIASPAVCMSRTYQQYNSRNRRLCRRFASEVAQTFMNRMNSPEATAAVEISCGRRSDDAHWLNVLTYNKSGNLQAVFDEYAHLISSGIDKDETMLKHMHREICSSIDIRTTQYNVDTYGNFKARVKKEGSAWNANMRSHYAVAFTKGEGKESDTDRKKVIRNAFNSPFRPFVLASTSIGQEGLDFHNYCRRIVHWNLPSNPIDLEQREGRINRFECLSIRQNVAKRYGDIQFREDIWKEMFSEAEVKEKELAGGESDIIPFWGLTEQPDMVKIERIVPMYPLSRDEVSYERLMKILSLYRLTLGQARQEELLEYIFNHAKEDEIKQLKELFINLSPYYKKEHIVEDEQ